MILARKLIELIERNASTLGERWSRAVLNHPLTPSYSRLPKKELRRRAENVYASLGKWLDNTISSEEAKRRYQELGKRRCQEGFDITELMVALILERTLLWDLVEEKGMLDSVYDMHAALELLLAVISFFDRASVYVLQGYREEEGGIRLSPERRPGPYQPTGVWYMPGDLLDGEDDNEEK